MTQRVRRSFPFDPLSIPWHTAFWASDPEWTPPNDGVGVSSWRDASTDGSRSASQATSSLQPVYRASEALFNGKPVVEGDGVDDFLATSNFTSIGFSNTIVAVARKKTLTASRDSMFDGSGSTARHEIYVDGGVFRMYAGGFLNGPAHNTDTHLFICEFNSDFSKFIIDGTTQAEGVTGTQSLTGITLFNNFGRGSAAGDYQIAFLGVYDGILTSEEKLDLLLWSRDFYDTP